MNREGNVYTIIFASLMVVIVGGLLAFIASSLRSAQQDNVKNEKMRNIIQAIDPSFDGEALKLMSRKEVEDLFAKHVQKRIILDIDGNKVSELTSEDLIDSKNVEDAFNLNPRKQYATISNIKKGCKGDAACLVEKMREQNITAPMFVCEKDGQTVYVAHFSGKGLWDDIWGYVGIKPSRRINASVFDHKAETPGLGSKITEAWFQEQYVGKTMATEDDTYKEIKVLKPGIETNEYQVNGISGATFTGVGVDEMMGRALLATHNYMKANVEKTEDTFSGAAVEYGYDITLNNMKDFKLNGSYSLQGDTLTREGIEGISTVVYLDDVRLLIKEDGKEFVTAYTK